MGSAIAAELAGRGAEVTLITGPTAIDLPPVASTVRVRSAAEMHRAVMAAVAGSDALIMAAAVANYTADHVAPQKIGHDDGELTLRLVPTTDIVAEVATWRPIRASCTMRTSSRSAASTWSCDIGCCPISIRPRGSAPIPVCR